MLLRYMWAGIEPFNAFCAWPGGTGTTAYRVAGCAIWKYWHQMVPGTGRQLRDGCRFVTVA
jgi:hypothetical protein